MKRSIVLLLLLCMMMSCICTPAGAAAISSALINEDFESSTGGFESLSRVSVKQTDAVSDGMSGKVLEIDSEKAVSSTIFSIKKS